MSITEIKFDQVVRTYNGKSGCMCGCNGTYKIPSHVSIEQANQKLGYNGHDQSSVSDRSVKIAVSKVNKALGEQQQLKDLGINVGVEDHGDEKCAFIDDGNRNTVVYFQ